MATAGNLEILVSKNLVVFRYVQEGNVHVLEATADQARAIARGLLKAAEVLEPSRKLFAIATEKVTINEEGHKQWVPGGIEFLHANDVHQARMTFERARKPGEEIRVVACAPALRVEEDGKGIILGRD